MRKKPGDEAFRVSFKLPRRKWDQRLADFNIFSSIETRSCYSSLVLYLPPGLSEGYFVAKYKKFPGGIVFCVRFTKVSAFFTSAHAHVWHGICYREKCSKFSPVWKNFHFGQKNFIWYQTFSTRLNELKFSAWTESIRIISLLKNIFCHYLIRQKSCAQNIFCSL